MEDRGLGEGKPPTAADFDPLQEQLEDVGGELAALKRQAKHLLEAAQHNRTVSRGFDGES